MLDPLSLVPFALAAAGGRVNEADVSQHVSAGVTLLQRSATIVRALSGRRAGILVPMGPLVITALAAADGRGALLLDPGHSSEQWAAQLTAAGVGAVFTTTEWSASLPQTLPHILLDDAPQRARLIDQDRIREIDLGSHFALDLAGERDAEGSPDECLVSFAGQSDEDRQPGIASHGQLLREARALATRWAITPRDQVLVQAAADSVIDQYVALFAPLLVGAAVYTSPVPEAVRATITKVIGE